MSENMVKVFLRNDQKINEIGNVAFQSENVHSYCFAWTIKLLDTLSRKFPDHLSIMIKDKENNETLKQLKMPLTSKDLIMLARNEAANVDGKINFDLYNDSIDKKVIYSMKDLVRHFVIVGQDQTKFYGGYPRRKLVRQEAEVILVDLIGFQFQQDNNSGRQVLIGKDLPEGELDHLIFKNVVGEDKASYEQAKSDQTGRYIEVDQVYFDTKAYQMFVANDFLLVCIAVNNFSKEQVNLKFLEYGTGYFAGKYKNILLANIEQGIIIGMKNYLILKINKNIKAFEFPFYDENKAIIKICNDNNLSCKFSQDDALKRSYADMTDATTNCADPHVITGNEMGYTSVDAAIAQNLKMHAYQFSPIINEKLQALVVNEQGITTEEQNCLDFNKSNL